MNIHFVDFALPYYVVELEREIEDFPVRNLKGERLDSGSDFFFDLLEDVELK